MGQEQSDSGHVRPGTSERPGVGIVGHPSRSFGAVVAALALLCAAVACSGAGQQQAGETGTPHSLEKEVRGLFEGNPEVARLALPRGSGEAKVCASPQSLMVLYPGRGIYAVTGEVPFAPTRAASEVCDVRITTQPSSGHDIFLGPTCRIRLASRDAVEIIVDSALEASLAVGSGDEFAASECFYRLALVLEGYKGGLIAPVFGSYPDSAYFITKRDYVGPIVSPIIMTLRWRCRNIVRHYYSEQLESYVIDECLDLTEMSRVR